MHRQGVGNGEGKAMKTPVVIGVVVAVHCVALGTLLLTPGCGTPRAGGKTVDFQTKPVPAVLPAASTRDVMPKQVAKPRPKPFVEVDDFDDEEFKPATAATKKPVVKPAAPASKNYTVKKGDSLGHIAQWLKIRVSEIRELNPSIKNTDKIREGQVLKLPAFVNLEAGKPKRLTARPKHPVTPAAVALPVAAGGSASVLSGGEYVVVSGDYPGKIAQKLGVKLDDLMKANKITDPKKLKIGQKLVIPGVAAAPAAPVDVPLVPVEPTPIAPLSPLDAVAPATPGMTPAAPAAAPGAITEPEGELKPLVPVAAPAVPDGLKPLTPASASAPSAAPGLRNATMQKHIVAPGETLKDIAMLYTVTVADLMKANGMTGEAVTLGQSLTIPAP